MRYSSHQHVFFPERIIKNKILTIKKETDFAEAKRVCGRNITTVWVEMKWQETVSWRSTGTLACWRCSSHQQQLVSEEWLKVSHMTLTESEDAAGKRGQCARTVSQLFSRLSEKTDSSWAAEATRTHRRSEQGKRSRWTRDVPGEEILCTRNFSVHSKHNNISAWGCGVISRRDGLTLSSW